MKAELKPGGWYWDITNYPANGPLSVGIGNVSLLKAQQELQPYLINPFPRNYWGEIPEVWPTLEVTVTEKIKRPWWRGTGSPTWDAQYIGYTADGRKIAFATDSFWAFYMEGEAL